MSKGQKGKGPAFWTETQRERHVSGENMPFCEEISDSSGEHIPFCEEISDSSGEHIPFCEEMSDSEEREA